MFRHPISIGELLLILAIVLLLFGAKKLPELAKSLGKSLSEFKKGRDEGAASSETPNPEKKPEDKSPSA